MVCKHFFLFWRLPLHFLDGIFSNTKVLNVDQVLFFFFFSFVICDLLLFFCKSYVISVLTFRPVTHFELSFLHMVWGRYLWRRQWRPTPVLSPGKSHGRRSLEGCSPGVAKNWTQLSDFTFTFHFHALEKEMATHSSVLAWRIPGTMEPGGLPSMGSHRVRHD